MIVKKKKTIRKRRKKYITCHCKNSECLKLYCECFSKFGFCSDKCRCEGCKNKKGFEEKR